MIALDDNKSTESVQRSARRPKAILGNELRKTVNGPLLCVICAYLLGLASIAVVVISGQFPWFTLAPAFVLIVFARIRHIESTLQRGPSN